MARYRVEETEIKRYNSTIDFVAKEIADYARAQTLLEDVYYLLPVPRIQHKIVLSPHMSGTISLYVRDEMSDEEKESCFMSNDDIIDIANKHYKLVDTSHAVKNLWLIDGEVIFIGGANNAVLVDKRQYAYRIETNLRLLVDLSLKHDGKEISDYLILGDDDKISYVMPNGMGKMFLPFMADWFEDKFPGLTTSKDDDDAYVVTETGLKFLLKLFTNECFATIVMENETLPKEGIFYLSNKIFTDSILTRTLPKKQLEIVSELLKDRNLNDWNLSESFFDSSVITELDPDTPPYKTYVEVAWHVFLHNIELFPIGCEVTLAPRQVILDKDDNLIFSSDDIYKIYYKGPDAVSPQSRNTVSIIVSDTDIKHMLHIRMKKYFKETFDIDIKAIGIKKGKKKKGKNA